MLVGFSRSSKEGIGPKTSRVIRVKIRIPKSNGNANIPQNQIKNFLLKLDEFSITSMFSKTPVKIENKYCNLNFEVRKVIVLLCAIQKQ